MGKKASLTKVDHWHTFSYENNQAVEFGKHHQTVTDKKWIYRGCRHSNLENALSL
jgi:hypothetical protein